MAKKKVKKTTQKKTMRKKPRKGRPQYKPTKNDLRTVYELAKKGCNEQEIANALGISYSTFRLNKKQFSAPIKKGRREGTPKNIKDVENALLKRAKGFEYTETHIFEQITKDGDIVTLHKTITKMIPPDTTAIIFFLCNKGKKRGWQHVQKIEHGSDPDNPFTITVKGDLSKYPKSTQEEESEQ